MDADTFARVVIPALGDRLEFEPPCTEFVPPDTVTMQIDQPTFDLISTLSDAFGTRSINMRTERENIGGCDTCDFSYDVGFITIEDITRWPGVG